MKTIKSFEKFLNENKKDEIYFLDLYRQLEEVKRKTFYHTIRDKFIEYGFPCEVNLEDAVFKVNGIRMYLQSNGSTPSIMKFNHLNADFPTDLKNNPKIEMASFRTVEEVVRFFQNEIPQYSTPKVKDITKRTGLLENASDELDWEHFENEAKAAADEKFVQLLKDEFAKYDFKFEKIKQYYLVNTIPMYFTRNLGSEKIEVLQFRWNDEENFPDDVRAVILEVSDKIKNGKGNVDYDKYDMVPFRNVKHVVTWFNRHLPLYANKKLKGGRNAGIL